MRHGVDFFRDEIRNGFYIPTAVKMSWAAALDVLSVIDEICKKHDITYYADWGSFLGAVRHGGFVPWDDDLDICMKRDDYNRFRAVCDNELPENYCIHDYERHKDHWLFLARVVNNRHISFNEKFLDENYNFPWLSGVDIYLKDYLYRYYEEEKRRSNDILRLLAQAEPILETDRERAIEIYKKAEQRMAEVPENEADEIGQIFPWILKGSKGEDKRAYENAEFLPFEDTYIPVPFRYNAVLKRRYGDYNIIRKGVAGHDYPFFEGQRKAFEKETGAKLPRFEFIPEMLERPEVTAPDAKSGERKAVLFLPIGPKEWKSLEQIYKKEIAKQNTDVYVVPLPLMPKDYFGNVNLSDEEIMAAVNLDKYPDYIKESAYDFSTVDLDNTYFNRIYIQSPYDEWNPLLTIPPYYYSEGLRFITDELIYIPLGPVGEYVKKDAPDMAGMNFYVTMPGCMYADKILVQSENIRDHYIEKLSEFATGSQKSYWENKIVAEPFIYSELDENRKVTEKKRILFGIASYEYYENPECFGEALYSRLDIFMDNRENVEVDICLFPEPCNIEKPNDEDEYRLSGDKGYESFKGFVMDAADEYNVNIRSTFNVDTDDFVDRYSAYYGSSMPIVHEFVLRKKPVMIADYKI